MRSGKEDALNIGGRLELFIDDYLVDTLDGAKLRMHEPARMPLPESPLAGGYITVIKDGGTYRGYYRRYKPGWKGELKDGIPAECTCYSESGDGIEWIEPDLNLVKEDDLGGYKNAILDEAPFAHNFSPFLDTRPDVPEDQRYKALAGIRESGLHAFASGDGIHWNKISEGPVIPYNREIHGNNAFDSQNVSFWSEAEQRYVCYFRHWKAPVRPRSISRATSGDFINWHDESASLRLPNLAGEQLYTSQTHPYFRAPHVYIALATRFTKGFVGGSAVSDKNGKPINQGSTDVMLMSFRPGENGFRRPFLEAFLRPGLDPEGWDNRANYLAINVVPTGPDRMSIYSRRGYRYVLRTDGFASVNAPFSGGELVTRPLIFDGQALALNLSTAIRGGIRAELQNAGGAALPGFALDDCEPIIGDRIEHVVAWKRGYDVGDHAGKPVRLRLELKDSDVFSFRFR